MRTPSSHFPRLRTAGCLLAAFTSLVMCGCSRTKPDPESDQFFTTWLQGHGESNIVVK